MRNYKHTFFLFLLLQCSSLYIGAQIKIGGGSPTVHPAAILQLESTDKGLLLPRLADTAAINLLQPPNGTCIFLNTDSSLRIRRNNSWKKLAIENETRLITQTDYNNSSNNVANATAVPDLSFTAEAGKEYKIDAWLLVQTANVNNGLRIALSGPAAGMQFAAIEIMVPSTQTAQLVANFNTCNTYIQGTRLPAAAQVFLARINGLVKMGASSGQLGIKFYSEANAIAVSIKAGSTLEYKVL